MLTDGRTMGARVLGSGELQMMIFKLLVWQENCLIILYFDIHEDLGTFHAYES